jgi:hypothetical protein
MNEWAYFFIISPKENNKLYTIHSIVALFFFYMIPRPFASVLPTADIDDIDQQPKPFFSSARNHISPAAQIAINQLALFDCHISPPPEIMNNFPLTLLPPPPHVIAMGDEINRRQSLSRERVA